ncbi:hypothetical protein G4Y79_06605 [Phototrophicus methaneseepsis]|uniref:Uncharacterized protein n=1 Tax=Phototrophicus methaneseepsis TaxID=2710758 RepID=A0A7S8IG08_9CHLR|nr:hypothetical protein [Phototrophicus methaneseepsis]QPC84044.1 hypothetical protein G4Y79_06605 [Phototrophicus methaneseepsis]
MACKYLSHVVDTLPAENLNPTANPVPIPVCQLRRNIGHRGVASRCQATSQEGPCWLWLSEYGHPRRDAEFQHGVEHTLADH